MQFSNCTSTCPESGVCSTYYPPTMPCRKRTCVSACNLCPGLCSVCTCIEICGCMLEFLKSIGVHLSLQKCIYICELTAVSRVLFYDVMCLCQGRCVEHIHCACTSCLCVSIKDLSLCSDGCSNARAFSSSSESLLPPYMCDIVLFSPDLSSNYLPLGPPQLVIVSNQTNTYRLNITSTVPMPSSLDLVPLISNLIVRVQQRDATSVSAYYWLVWLRGKDGDERGEVGV